jgi:hypothetical protein
MVRHLAADWNSTLLAMEQLKEVLDLLMAQPGLKGKQLHQMQMRCDRL